MTPPVLEYEHARPAVEDRRPRPVGRRTLLAGLSLGAAAGICGVGLAAQAHAHIRDTGCVILLLGGVAVLLLALMAAMEAMLFPQHVSDPRTAARSALVNLLLGLALISAWSWIA